MAATVTSHSSDTFVLRETILSQTLPTFGKIASALYRDVEDDFGSCVRRRFQRALKFLVDGGLVSARTEYVEELDQIVPVYYRARQRGVLTVTKRRYACRLCGMLDTYTSSHPMHSRVIRELRGAPPQYVMPGSRPATR